MKKNLFLPIALVTLSCFLQSLLAQNSSPYWSLAGNSNATLSNKIGTTNNVSLRFVTNNAERMKIHSGGNVGIGTTGPVQKLDVNGNINLATGFRLYMENHPVLRVDSVNTNIFLGNGVGFNNTGKGNTATGNFALSAGNSGYFNTATGLYALASNTTAYANVANGYRALYLNTTGGGNTALGAYSLYSNITGFGNTGAGHNALTRCVYGSGNTAVGSNALSAVDNAWGNTAIGFQAGYNNAHGYYNTFVGWNANSNVRDLYNTMALGSNATVTAPNQVRIGNSYTSSIGGNTGWSNLSDGRVKRNIKENVPGLSFINKLKPITYNLDLVAADNIMGIATRRNENENTNENQSDQTEAAARAAKQKIVYTGFVAQDVEKAAKELGYDFSGVDAAKNGKDLYGLRYSEFVVPLVKAVQELSQRIEDLSKENREIKKQLQGVEELKERLQRLEARIITSRSRTTMVETPKDVTPDMASLEQNIPNPATGNTRILFSLPKGTSSAQLLLADNNGKTVRTAALTTSGAIDINTSDLGSGVYNYSLIINGKIVQTKRLAVVR